MTLEERLARLEKQNRRLLIVALCMMSCLVLVVGMGAAAVQDQGRLILQDQGGRWRIQLLAHPENGPMINLYDNTTQSERLRIGLDPSAGAAPFIWFMDQNGQRVKIF